MKNILKILEKDNPYDKITDLYNSGELLHISPELCNLYSDEEGYKNNFTHTMLVLKNVCELKNDYKLKLVALLHDIGKPSTKRYDDKKGWTFYNHEKVGADMSINILKNWGVTDRQLIDYVYRMIMYHGRIKIGRNSNESAIRRLDKEVGKDIIFDLIDFAKCDMTTKFQDKKLRIISFLDELKEKIIKVRQIDEDAKWKSPLTGNLIMELLDIGEGREIGLIKKELDSKLKSNEITLDDAIQYINENKSKWIN